MTISEMLIKLANSRKEGFAGLSSREVIHIFTGGSQLHGCLLPNSESDTDIYGVYVEPPYKALGITEETHYTESTQDQYEKNRPGDVDYKFYTLRRWASLAARGNPTINSFLFTKPSLNSVWSQFIINNTNIFKASSHGKSYLGYANSQCARLLKIKGLGKHGQRTELQKEFGFDTKAASHLIRLMYEASEYLLTGNITYPRPEAETLVDIRQGKWSLGKVILEYAKLEAEVKGNMEKSLLPKSIDYEAISRLISACYLYHWKDNNQSIPIITHTNK